MNTQNKTRLRNIVNKVRANAPKDYQDNVIQLGDSLAQFSESFFEYEPAINDFAKGLINLFAKIIWTEGGYTHNLDFLKKGTYETGIDIEDIHTNPTMPALYDRDDTTGILGHYDPDTMAIFHRENRHDIFPQTMNEEILKKAFQSWDNLGAFISRVLKAVEDGNQLREFNLLKKAIVDGYKVNDMFVTKTVDMSSDEGVANTMATIREDVNNFQFVSANFNKYAQASGTGNSAQLVSKKDDIFIMTTTKNEAKVRKYLSGVFNMQELEDANRFILVDDFGYDIYEKTEDARQLVVTGHETSDIAFLIADRRLVQWWERLKVKTIFENGYTLDVNSFLHIWQIISLSYLANAVVYIESESPAPQMAVRYETDKSTEEGQGITTLADTIKITFYDENDNIVPIRSRADLIISSINAADDFTTTPFDDDFTMTIDTDGCIIIGFNTTHPHFVSSSDNRLVTISTPNATAIFGASASDLSD